MIMLHEEQIYNRPCCALLKQKTHEQESLDDPAVSTDLLACLSKNCVLLKEMGSSRIKLDTDQRQCYFLIDPTSTREILNKVSETITIEGLVDYYKILNAIETSLAKNPLLQEIVENFTLFLATLRTTGEKKFGAVPDTVEKNITQSPELSETRQFTEDHPRLETSPQFDGAPPSQTPIINNNPQGAAQVQRLQAQHLPKPGFNPRPHQP